MIYREHDPLALLADSDILRVNCLGFCRIPLTSDGRVPDAADTDVRFLAVLNRAKLQVGEREYFPVGGAYKFHPAEEPYLRKIIEQFEYEYSSVPEKDRYDLRFTIRVGNIPLFKEWYEKGKPKSLLSKLTLRKRQTSDILGHREFYPFSELEEELVTEEGILSTTDGLDIWPYFQFNEPIESTRPELNGMLTKSNTDFFDVRLSPEQAREVMASLEKNERVALLTREEIRQGYAQRDVEGKPGPIPISRLLDLMVK
jgi:hypothetical protein